MTTSRASLNGVRVADDTTARWLETLPSAVDCIEIRAEGFFSRPSPYLAWLGRYPLVLRTPPLFSGGREASSAATFATLGRLCRASQAHSVVHPLALSAPSGIQLPEPAPFSLTAASLHQFAHHVKEVATACERPVLIEPITAPLRVPGSIRETEFLQRLCRKAGCRLLIDLTTLLIASRNQGFDPRAWLLDIPADLIAAARIGGSQLDRGRWRHDPRGEIDEAAWELLDVLLAGARPDMLLLGHRQRPGGIETIERELARLRSVGARERGGPETPEPRAVEDGRSRLVGPQPGVPDSAPVPTLPGIAAVSDAGPTARPSSSSAPLEDRHDPPLEDRHDPRGTGRPNPPRPGFGSGTLQIAPDVALFVLDHEGVFFSPARHELTLFNTPATFVWLLLEEGQTPAAIGAVYEQTFGVTREEAERHVGTILRDWFGRGDITHPGPLPRDPLPLTRALALLLTNPELRAQYTRSPGELADLLNVAPEERDVFTALDPDELREQAEAGTRGDPTVDASSRPFPRKVSADDGAVTTPEPAEQVGDHIDATAGYPSAPLDEQRRGTRADAAPAPAPGAHTLPAGRLAGSVRCYRLLTTTFGVRCESADLLRHIDEALGHLSSPGREPDVIIDIRATDEGGWALLDGDAVEAECRGPEGVVPAVKQLLREQAVDRYSFLLSVHAGVVAFDSRCVLLPAAAGSGKTTLTAALVRAGGTYFSDEIALLEDGSLAVTPVPLALTVKDGSVAPLSALYPEVETLTSHVREDFVRVRYMPPPADSLPRPDRTAVAQWIVFPQFTPGADTTLSEIARPTALRKLLDESFLDTASLDRARVESLVQWMRSVDCYELSFSSLDAAVELLLALTRAQQPPLVG